MAYSLGGTITATDWNNFVSTMNAGWSTGSGSSGYGQPTFPTVSAGDTIRARPATVTAGNPPTWSTTPEWRTLINSINVMSEHQIGTTPIASGDFNVASSLPVVATAPSGIIGHATTVSPALTAVTGSPQRLNAVAQGAQTSQTMTNGATWSNVIQYVWLVTFGSDDQLRWFFNAGGQIGFQFSHPAGGVFNINQLISDLCSDIGTIWHSSTTSGTISLAGSSYTGVTKVGGANPGGYTGQTNRGFYALTNLQQDLATQTSDFYYFPYNGTTLTISGERQGPGVLRYICVVDEVPDGAVASAGTTNTILVRPPSTTYLANSWGPATVNGSVTSS